MFTYAFRSHVHALYKYEKRMHGLRISEAVPIATYVRHAKVDKIV